MEVPFRSTRTGLPLGAWILIAVSLNILLATGGGYGWDVGAWAHWVDDLQVGGYAAQSATYPPLFVHWLWLCGKLLTLLQLTTHSAALLRFLVVTPVLVCQVLLLLLTEQLSRAQPDAERIGWLSGFVALNPALLIDGPLWGQVDLIHCLMLVYTLHLLIAGRYLILVLPLLMLAVLTKFQSICLLPVLLPLLWRRRCASLWLGAIPALLLAELALLPYWLAGTAVSMLREAYVHASSLYPNASMNADNLWYLLGLNMVNDSLPLFNPALLPAGLGWLLTPRILGEGLFILWSLWLLFSTWRADQAEYYWRNAMLSALGFFLLLPDMHERYLFPAVVLALVAAAQYARFARHAVALSVLTALNILLVLELRHDGPLPYVISAVLLAYGLCWLGWPLLARLPLRRLEALPLWVWMVATLLVWVLALTVHVERALPAAAPPASTLQAAPPSGIEPVDATRIPGRTSTQGWGSLHIGQSVEGNTLSVAGKTWPEGFGTHAPSIIHMPVPPHAARFTASVGVDDEAHGGRVAFQVFADRQKIWDSGAIDSGEAPHAVDLDVTGRVTLDLVVDPLGDNSYDHADWLQPRFVFGR